MLDGELFMLGEIRGAFISDGAWSLRGWNGMFRPMAPVNALVAACLGTSYIMRRPCPSIPASIMMRPDTGRRFAA